MVEHTTTTTKQNKIISKMNRHTHETGSLLSFEDENESVAPPIRPPTLLYNDIETEETPVIGLGSGGATPIQSPIRRVKNNNFEQEEEEEDEDEDEDDEREGPENEEANVVVQAHFVYCIECGVKNMMFEQGQPCSACESPVRTYMEEEEEEEGPVPFNPFQKVTSLDPRSPEEEVYEVRFLAGDSGISFDDDWMGKALVVDDLPRADYFAKQVQKVHRGDYLVSINSASVAGLPLDRVEEMLQEAQEKEYRLRFRQALKVSEAFGRGGLDAAEARSVIYKQKSKSYEPPEHMDMVYGYVQRYRGEKITSFHFFREADNRFMLGAMMRRDGKGRIMFHNTQDIKVDGDMKEVAPHRDNAKFLGSMVPNFLGTSFTAHDYRVDNPTSTRKRIHHELAYVLYDTNVTGRVPNSLRAVLPRWDPEQGLRGQAKALSKRYSGTTKKRLSKDLNVLQKLNASKLDEYQAVEVEEQEDLLIFETKKPSWNEQLQAYTLNFNGRVKLPSKKNFLLVPQAKNEAMDEEYGADTLCLRFGKVTKHKFTLDFRHPISPFQAFAIAITTFSDKKVVT